MSPRSRILIVDDSKTAVMITQMLLAKEGYEVVVARDGQEGVDKARELKPDLILMDVMMPRLDGFAACRAIRAGNDGTAHTPIIMCTTRGEAANIEAGYAHGCSDFVTKPINALELLTKVRSLLSLQGQAGEVRR